MKNKNLKLVLSCVAFGMMITLFSSCSRGGYGCPYEMKLPVISFLK